jgi:hypothetical protein
LVSIPSILVRHSQSGTNKYMNVPKEQIKVGCAYMFKHVGGERVEPNHIVFVLRIDNEDDMYPVTVSNNPSGQSGLAEYDELYYIKYPSKAFTVWTE